MLKEERLKAILKEISLHNTVLSTDLSDLLGVSDDTIRRDLKELADAGKIIKTHGGAVSPSFVSTLTDNTEIYAHHEKKVIAQKAVKLLKNDSVILIEGGTTVSELAKTIPSNLRASFYTTSPQTAMILASHENIDVTTIGGKLERSANLHTGAEVINRLSEINADLCILGANAFSIEKGLTDVDWEVSQVVKAMVRSSKKNVILTISEKLNSNQRIHVCPFEKIDILVTELEPGNEILSVYNNTHLKVI